MAPPAPVCRRSVRNREPTLALWWGQTCVNNAWWAVARQRRRSRPLSQQCGVHMPQPGSGSRGLHTRYNPPGLWHPATVVCQRAGRPRQWLCMGARATAGACPNRSPATACPSDPDGRSTPYPCGTYRRVALAGSRPWRVTQRSGNAGITRRDTPVVSGCVLRM